SAVNHRFCQRYQSSAFISAGDASLITTHQNFQGNKEETLDKLALIGYINENDSYANSLYNIFRSGINTSSKISA
ncbi:unnamed protein product, partial [Rotaria sordida]